MRTLLVTAALAVVSCAAQASPVLEVESIYDNAGLFQYKVKSGSDISWNFPTSGSFFMMTLPGATDLITPDGWVSQLLGNDQILWKAGATAQNIGPDPIIFGARSTYTDLARYGRYNGDTLLDPNLPAGSVAAFAVVPGGGSPVLGYLGFEYVGPMAAPVPEPAGLGAALLGGLYFLRRRQAKA